MKVPVFLSALLLAAGVLSAQEEKTKVVCDIWISGGTVIDGSGAPAREAEVLIRDGKIIHVGVLPDILQADREIRADGLAVTPGFIDAHAHGDPLEDGAFQNFISMGVTSICLGQDGSSPAYEDIRDWFAEVDAAPPAVNVLPFVGHGTLRRMSGIGLDTDPSPKQMEAIQGLLDDAMKAGCFGMSTGLEYYPGIKANQEELNALGKVVGMNGGMVMSHMRSEDKYDMAASLNELIEQGRAGAVPVHVSHMKVVYGTTAEEAYPVLHRMQEARDNGIRVTADVYPYTASFTGVGILFPEWAMPPNDYLKVKEERGEELAEYLRNRVNKRNGPEATLFGTKPYAGMTLKEVAEEAGKPFEEVLRDDIGPLGASAAYFVMSDPVLERFLVDPHVMVSSDGSPTMRHPRGYGSFAKIIRKYVVEDGLLPLETAIHKMSGLTAETVGLTETTTPRGLIKEGYAADILVFDPAKVRDTATFEEPHQLAEGFDFVLVNGTVVKDEEGIKDERPGLLLRKK